MILVRCIGFLSLLTIANAIATPAGGKHLASVDTVMDRLDKTALPDAARRAKITPLGVILTEPVIRALWAGQIITDSDWIGIKALASMSYRIDPGGADDASNMFVYTCKGGWVDLGHVIYSALAYKVIYQGINGNPLVGVGMNKFLPKHESPLYNEVRASVSKGVAEIERNMKEFKKKDGRAVAKDQPLRPLLFDSPTMKGLLEKAVKLRVQNSFRYTNRAIPEGKQLAKLVQPELNALIGYLNAQVGKRGFHLQKFTHQFWAGFFAMQAGFGIEVSQNATKNKVGQKKWDGNATSAWTLEDLPSDFYGVLLGSKMQRTVFQRSAVKIFKANVSDLLKDLNPVDPKNTTNVTGCPANAVDILSADADYYGRIAMTTPVSHKVGDSTDSNSPYNYTFTPKKTKSHHCVCDKNGEAINRRPIGVKEETLAGGKHRVPTMRDGEEIEQVREWWRYMDQEIEAMEAGELSEEI